MWGGYWMQCPNSLVRYIGYVKKDVLYETSDPRISTDSSAFLVSTCGSLQGWCCELCSQSCAQLRAPARTILSAPAHSSCHSLTAISIGVW